MPLNAHSFRRDNPLVAWHVVPGTTPVEGTVP